MNFNHSTSLPVLFNLIRRAQKASSCDELAFLLANDSHILAPYRQSALWLLDGGTCTLSGVVQVEANTPYVSWLSKLCQEIAAKVKDANNHSPRLVNKQEVSALLAEEWDEWLPAYMLWLPLVSQDGELDGGLIMAREQPWSIDEIDLLNEWVSSWQHAWLALTHSTSMSWTSLTKRLLNQLSPNVNIRWWRQPRLYWWLALTLLLMMPVHLSVLAPSELVPSNPALIRAPLDGVVGQFAVKPNEYVKAGQVLFSFDEATMLSRREVTSQGLATIQAEYRQQEQQALSDVKAKSLLAMTAGRIAEKQAELAYLEGQVSRLKVLAPTDGIALFDDPSEWVGKPVQTGERIMRIADPADVELEAWIAVGDAIPISKGAKISLYLNASPLGSISAKVRYMAHEAVQRPDGSYAYRVRAQLDQKSSQRVGLQGTARLNGEQVTLIYWITRRPIAIIRQTIGW